MEKLKMHSPDLTAEKIRQIAELLPNCVTESRGEDGAVRQTIDFDQLRQELSDHIVEGPAERYRLDWPGKRKATQKANEPTSNTLRPARAMSVNPDSTKNLLIVGDNLEALKLLQETYLSKVKVIYIDPPYNTGSDFIYKDDFAQSREEYIETSGQKDDEGNRLVLNSESNGRFHSSWLSMMYSRLKLARNLLADDGVFFASIDDVESANLKRLLDEIFGEQNFIDTIAVELSTTSGPKTVNAQQGTIVKNVEFVHIYRKSDAFDQRPHTPLLDGIAQFDTHYSVWMNEDGTLASLADKMLADDTVREEIIRYGLLERGSFSITSMDKLLAVSEPSKAFLEANLSKIASVDRPPVSANGKTPNVGQWEVFEAEHRKYFLTMQANGKLRALMPLSMNYRTSDDYKPRFGRTVIRGDLWKGFHQDMGNVAKEGEVAFANGKKPVRLIQQLIRWANNSKNGIVMDFFGGSGTTAHAVFLANADDDGGRRFILIQLNETPDPKSEEAKAGIVSIDEIARERISRAGKSVAASAAPFSRRVDVGFRVLKIDSSNMDDVYYTPDKTVQANLLNYVDNVKPDRRDKPEDLLFQVLLDWGVDLASPIASETIDGKQVFFVDGNALAACFDFGLTDEFVKQIAERKPLRAVFRDASYSSDAAKINVEQIFKFYSPETEVRCL